jgi:hypothetical protein
VQAVELSLVDEVYLVGELALESRSLDGHGQFWPTSWFQLAWVALG